LSSRIALGTLAVHSGVVLISNLIKQNAKHKESPKRSFVGNDMPKKNCRNANGDHLSRGHDDGENNRSKLLDCVEDAKLSASRSDCGDYVVSEGLRIVRKKLKNDREVPGDDETSCGDANCRHIDS